MQYGTRIDGSTVAINNGSNSLVGTNTKFLSNVAQGSWWSPTGSGVSYLVGNVVDDTHITLASNYAGPNLSGASYAITTSFTNRLQLPYPGPADIDVATILARAMAMLDAVVDFANAPVTVTAASYAMAAADTSIIANRAGTVTLTLLSAALNPGRKLWVRTIQNQTLVSASANVVPLAGGSPGTAILSNTAGKWALLQSDGSSWQIMAAN